jgi:hypothetical protein
MRKVVLLGVAVLSLALAGGAVGTADAKKKKPKPASLSLTVTPNHLKVGQKYTAELKGFSGRFTKLAVDGHSGPCANTVKAENQTQTIYTHAVQSKRNYDWSLKFTVGAVGTRHVCAYLYDPSRPGDTKQRHKSATYTATAR